MGDMRETDEAIVRANAARRDAARLVWEPVDPGGENAVLTASPNTPLPTPQITKFRSHCAALFEFSRLNIGDDGALTDRQLVLIRRTLDEMRRVVDALPAKA